MFELAARIEGHPDNVAPAVFGGLTLAYEADAQYHAVRLDVRPDVEPFALVPEHPMETEVARGLLPTSVSHADAVFNSGRTALLVAALTAPAGGGAPVDLSVLVAAWYFGTPLTPLMILGGIVALTGVAIVTIRSAKAGEQRA